MSLKIKKISLKGKKCNDYSYPILKAMFVKEKKKNMKIENVA